MSYFIYAVYNLGYQLLSLWLLFYANTYLNGFLIPDSLRWKDGKLREDLSGFATAQAVILVVEAAVFLLLLHYINRWYLSSVAKVDDPTRVAFWTAMIYAVITLGLVFTVIYSNYR